MKNEAGEPFLRKKFSPAPPSKNFWNKKNGGYGRDITSPLFAKVLRIFKELFSKSSLNGERGSAPQRKE
jgi:hypothetical protein